MSPAAVRLHMPEEWTLPRRVGRRRAGSLVSNPLTAVIHMYIHPYLLKNHTRVRYCLSAVLRSPTSLGPGTCRRRPRAPTPPASECPFRIDPPAVFPWAAPCSFTADRRVSTFPVLFFQSGVPCWVDVAETAPVRPPPARPASSSRTLHLHSTTWRVSMRC